MTRQALLYGAVNLSQGFPDFPAPSELKLAAQDAIAQDVNQYAITWGSKKLRNAIAAHTRARQGIRLDRETEITVCCGSTEAMISTLLAVCNAGDEVIVFEPFYENYGPELVLSGAKPRFVKLRPPTTTEGEWAFDAQELRAAFHDHTKAIIINTPNNPNRQRRRQEARSHSGASCVLSSTPALLSATTTPPACHGCVQGVEPVDQASPAAVLTTSAENT